MYVSCFSCAAPSCRLCSDGNIQYEATAAVSCRGTQAYKDLVSLLQECQTMFSTQQFSDLWRHAPPSELRETKVVDMKDTSYSLHTNDVFLEEDGGPAELSTSLNDTEKVCLTTTTCYDHLDCVHRCMPACLLWRLSGYRKMLYQISDLASCICRSLCLCISLT